MKALESAPKRYDTGIQWLGGKSLETIRNRITELTKMAGNKVLEIGVGTGTQALAMAENGLL